MHRGENHFTVLRSFAASVLQRFGVVQAERDKSRPEGDRSSLWGLPPLPCPQRGLWPRNAEELGLIAQAQVRSHTPRRGIYAHKAKRSGTPSDSTYARQADVAWQSPGLR